MTSEAQTAPEDHRRNAPPSITATLHAGPEHVAAQDLTDYQRRVDNARADLASLTFGADNVRVVLLGPVATLKAIVSTASAYLDEVIASRLQGTNRTG